MIRRASTVAIVAAGTLTVGMPPRALYAAPLPSIPAPSPVHLTFDDEFDGAALDTTKWSTAFAAHNRLRPGDQGYYAAHAVTVADGNAVITSTDQAENDRPYTTGVLCSAGNFWQRGGIFEIRAQLPQTRGLLASFWLNARDNPPEIDGYEVFGQSPRDVEQTNHWRDPDTRRHRAERTDYMFPATDSAASMFHTYDVVWDPGRSITWFVDGHLTSTHTTGVPDEPMYMYIQLSVKPPGPAAPTAESKFPAVYRIDYVRVFQSTD